MDDRTADPVPAGQRLAALGLPPLLGGYALLHALAAACGFALIPPALSQAILWPPVGLLLSVLVALPVRRWPGLLLVAVVVELAAGLAADWLTHRPDVAFGWRLYFPVSNAMVALVGAVWVRQVVGWPPRPSLKSLALSVAGAAVAAGSGAFFGALGLFYLTDQPFLLSFQLWWASDLLGIVAIAPALLGLLVRPAAELASNTRLETAALWLVGAVLTVLVFGHDTGHGLFQAPYVLYPLFVWAGVRFPPLHVAVFGLTFALVASVLTLAGEGPFANDVIGTLANVTPLQYFLVVTLVTALGLARAVDDHRQTIARLEATSRRLRGTARELVSVEERARRGIAQDLHDGLAQVIAGLRMMLAPLVADPRRDDAAEILGQARGMLGEAESQTRSLLADLNPPGLDDGGLVPALELLTDRMERRHALEIGVDTAGALESLGPERRALLYRLASELLMNVAKHAGVREAALRLEVDTGGESLVVEDRGRGFDPSAPTRPTNRGGMGLASVQDRVAAIGGTVQVRSAPGEGCRVEVRLPPAIGANNPGNPDPAPSL
jgi:signal transduction histidine kinase